MAEYIDLEEALANPEDVTELNLSGEERENLPSEIGLLTNLTELILCENNLTALPSEIGQLTKLTNLDLRQNSLRSLPSEIGQLTNLTQLLLSDNKLESLPDISGLDNLIELELNSNQLFRKSKFTLNLLLSYFYPEFFKDRSCTFIL